VAWLYALVTGFNAPCVRSAAALTLVIAAGYFFRERRPLNLLAAVALGFLLFDPDQLFDASFQLSFLAVAFLGAFATPMIRATSGPLGRGLAISPIATATSTWSPRGAISHRDAPLAETLHGARHGCGESARGKTRMRATTAAWECANRDRAKRASAQSRAIPPAARRRSEPPTPSR